LHTRLGREVAIKVLNSSAQEHAHTERLLAEARLQASLLHPGIATLYDFLEHKGQGCIVMEFVEGPTVAEYIQAHGRIAEKKALDILRQVCQAVRYLHAQGIIHRDLKPANIKLSADGTIKLLDFGIAHSLRSLTIQNSYSLVGTFEYSAPECLTGKRADQRSDIWSLGVLLYEMFTGRLPFSGKSLKELSRQINNGSFRPVSNTKVDYLLSRCLQKDPLRRFKNIEALQAALSLPSFTVAWLTLNHRVRVLALSAFVFVVVFLAWHFITPGPRPRQQPQPRHAEAKTLKTVSVDAVNGPAEVFREGRDLGITPISIQEPPGEHVSLLLKRNGFADLPVDFDVSERSNYSYVLHEIEGDH
jgi:serine/threonine-protein kinase